MTSRPATAADLGLGLDPALPADRRVNLTNWQIGPFNRWAFQHIPEIVRSARIPCGEDGPRVLVPAARPLAIASLPDPDGGEITFEQWLEATWTDAIVVLHDGQIAGERYLNGMTPGTTHLLMSVSKSITALLAGIVVGRGLLDPAALVGTILPELGESAYADATVQQVLDMQVAAHYSEAYEDPASEVQQHDRVAGWRPRLPSDPAGDYAFLAGLRKTGPHGVVFQYCSATTDVLGWLLERVTGEPLPALLSRELWAPMGAAHDATITVDECGAPFPNGGICVTARDLARLGQLVLDGGARDGEQIVPAAWIADIRTNGSRAAWQAEGSSAWAGIPDGAYRNQFWITNDARGSFFGAGIHGQNLWIDPTSRVVIAKLSSQPRPVDDAVFALQRSGLEAIARAFTD